MMTSATRTKYGSSLCKNMYTNLRIVLMKDHQSSHPSSELFLFQITLKVKVYDFVTLELSCATYHIF